MEVHARILEDMKAASKNKDNLLKSVTRMLLSEIEYAHSPKGRFYLDDQSVKKVLRNYRGQLIKRLLNEVNSDSLEAIKERITIVDRYLPADDERRNTFDEDKKVRSRNLA